MYKLKAVLLVLIIFEICYSQEPVSPINVEAQYVGEHFFNYSGGIKTGIDYLGIIDFGISGTTDNLGLWKNGEFAALIENSHGGTPSADYIGDLQVASNIENGDYTYLYELWYKQQIGPLGLKFGLMDLNADCHVSDLAGHYLNSSFGIMPTASLNMPTPIFPVTALGIFTDLQLNNRTNIIAGVWDGNPGDLDNNPYNIQWSLNGDEGYLYMLEGHYNYGGTNGKTGLIKIGGLFHSGKFEYLTDSTRITKDNFELHLIAEQSIIHKAEGEKGNLDAFLQVGYSPKEDISTAPFYAGFGLNYSGLLNKNAEDVLGLAFAYAGISKELQKNPGVAPYEMAIELSYAIPILKNITLQPDFQYIIKTGADTSLNNAFVGFIRIIITS